MRFFFLLLFIDSKKLLSCGKCVRQVWSKLKFVVGSGVTDTKKNIAKQLYLITIMILFSVDTFFFGQSKWN